MKARQLRSKEVKQLKQAFPFLSGKRVIEVKISGELSVFLEGDKPVLCEKEGVLFPTLFSGAVLPEAVVDMGAVRFVTSGADVMAPGIRKFPEFRKDDLLYVVDEKNHKRLAVVRALVDSKDFPERGKVFKNLHHVGDKIWKKEWLE